MDKVKELIAKIKQVIGEVSPRNRLYILLFALFSFLLVIAYWVLIYFISIDEAQQAEADIKALGIQTTELDSSESDPLNPDDIQDDTNGQSSNKDIKLPAGVTAAPNSSQGTQYRDIKEEDLQAHRELIELFSERELYRKSLKHIERVANYLSDDIVFQAQAGEAYFKAGQPKQALPHLKKALSAQGNDIDLNLQMAQVTFALNQPEKAITRLTNLYEKFPAEKKVKLALASSMAEIEPQSKEAKKLFDELKKSHPKDPLVWYQSARQWMNQGNFASSKRELRKALNLDPLDNRIHARMGMAEFYLRQFKSAKKHYRTALSMNPDDYNTWYNLGELKYTLANTAYQADTIRHYSREALSHFLQTLSLETDHPKAHYRVGQLLNSNKQFKEAIDHFKKALERQPDHVNSLIGIAIAYEAVGHKELAIENLERAYYLDPFNRVLADKLYKIRS